MSRRILLLTALAAMATGCAGQRPAPTGAPATAADPGKAFVQRACAGCHAVEPTGASPNGRAPAFRDLASRRSDAELAAALGEISRNGHVEMPPIYITPDEMRQVVAYMRSLTAQTT